MLSFNRRNFCLGAFSALSACGFTPVYGPAGGASALENKLLVDAPQSRDAFLMTQEIEQRLGRSASPIYGLSTAIIVREEAIAINASNITTRYNLLGDVTYALRDLESGKVLSSGTVNNFTGYSASGSTTATQAAERDARARLMSILTDQMLTRLTATLPVPAQ